MQRRWWLIPLVGAVCSFVLETPSAAAGLPARAAVGAFIRGPRLLVMGSRASYRVEVHWATGPRRWGPLHGAAVTLLLDGGKQPVRLADARTDQTGSASLGFQVPGGATGERKLTVLVSSSLGSSRQSSPVQVYPGGRLLITTDKKLYQPSQTIHIRVLALRSIDLKPLAATTFNIEVKDPRGNLLNSKRALTSRFGVGSLDFQLADEISLGSYRIRAWAAGAGEAAASERTVEVARYQLPKFQVAVETERPYYRPGDVVRATVRAGYFFGKPVAGGRIRYDVRSQTGGRFVRGHTIPCWPAVQDVCRLDSDGRTRFELTLPRGGREEESGELRIRADVIDSAGQQQAGDLSVPVTNRPLQLAIVPESELLVPAVPNRVHVLTGYPDGKPAPGAEVELGAMGRAQRARADRLGIATFTVMPPARRARRAPVEDGEDDADPLEERAKVSLRASARDPWGQSRSVAREVELAPWGEALVRPSRSLIGRGDSVQIELLTADARGPIYLDVAKAGQTLATFTRAARQGRATVTFQPDASLFGLLELRAYRLPAATRGQGTHRLMYVEHPGSLRIAASTDRESYRPGERARLELQVSDSRTGEGVQAALGIVGVDEALVAMKGLEEVSPRLFFTLASEAQGEEPAVLPAGRSLERWVDDERGPSRARAAEVLLSALRPADAESWVTDPWRQREEAWEVQGPPLVEAARTFMEDHSVGLRTAKGWRFHPDLVAMMARAGAIRKEQAIDPWQQPVRPWQLREVDRTFEFAPLADRLAREKLSTIYERLVESWKTMKLARERFPGLARRKQPLILPADLLKRLVGLHGLSPASTVDPWGRPFRVLRHPRVFVDPYGTGLVSRYLIHSAGPDGISGTRDDIGPEGRRLTVPAGRSAADALGGLIGNFIGEAYGVGGLGLLGTGRGGGGAGEGTIGLGSIGTIGHGGGSGSGTGLDMPARVRSLFPETLIWRPELITDSRGRASLEIPLADSITDWRLLVTGSSAQGLLGTTSLKLRVFQEFFVDVDLPMALTQGDRISVPVTVYNYLKTPQRVRLRLQREDWYASAGPAELLVELAPSQVVVRHFPIVARRLGRQELTVRASAEGGGQRTADAVRRGTLVEPDGVEESVARAGTLKDGARHSVAIPARAIPGTQRVMIAMHPGPVSDALKGLEGMLQKPYGCFEQTSSTTYPNVLILEYLRRSGQATAALEEKARSMINLGYQRLLGFEVPGGGFSWFGHAPAHRVLTAYGLMEFRDMARVHPVDPELIRRTQLWLVKQQRPDGSWPPDGYNIHDGATNQFGSQVLRITAYLAHALERSGYSGEGLARARAYVRRHADQAKDAYTLALLANLAGRSGDGHARKVLQRLWAMRRDAGERTGFPGPAGTLTYGAGRSGDLETTALAALGLLAAPAPPGDPGRVVNELVAGKDSSGAWHSTQATILSLRALLEHQSRTRARVEGTAEVWVDGRRVGSVRVRPDEPTPQQIDLTPYAGAGEHRVDLRFRGKGHLRYQLVSRYHVPRAAEPGPAQAAGLYIRTRYDRTRVAQGEKVTLEVEAGNRRRQRVDMPLLSVSLPPGFSVAEEALTELVRRGRVEKVQRFGSQAVLYLSRLGAEERLRFTLRLEAKHPALVQARPSSIYEYYRPEHRAESAPVRLQVL